MQINDISGIVSNVLLVFLAWQQNRIFEKQNKIFEIQAGLARPEMPETPSQPSWLREYWPIATWLVIAFLTLAMIGYSLYRQRSTFPWTISLIVGLAALVLVVVRWRYRREVPETVRTSIRPLVTAIASVVVLALALYTGNVYKQPIYEIYLKTKYRNSLVVVRSVRKDGTEQVKNTGFFVDTKGTLITDAWSSFSDGEKPEDRNITIELVNGKSLGRPQLIRSPTDPRNISRFIYVYRVALSSTPIPFSSDDPTDNQLLTGVSIKAGAAGTKATSGKMKDDPTKSDRFWWYATTKGGANGSPVFNSSGQVVGILLLTGNPAQCVDLSGYEYWIKNLD